MKRNVYSSSVFAGGDLLSTVLHSKFYLDRIVAINHFWQQKTRDTVLPDGETASLCVSSF